MRQDFVFHVEKVGCEGMFGRALQQYSALITIRDQGFLFYSPYWVSEASILETEVPTRSITHTKHNIHIPLSTLHASVLQLTLDLSFIHTDTLYFSYCSYDLTTAYHILLVPLFTAPLRRNPSKDRAWNVSLPRPRPALSRKNLTCTPRITGFPTQKEDANARSAIVESLASPRILLARLLT
jgi:hypothetical protein